MWFIHPIIVGGALTAESEELARMFRTACDRAGIPMKAAASYMQIDPAQLTMELGGKGNLAAWRLLRMPVEWWIEFLPLLGGHLHLVLVAFRDTVKLAHTVLREFSRLVDRFAIAVTPQKGRSNARSNDLAPADAGMVDARVDSHRRGRRAGDSTQAALPLIGAARGSRNAGDAARVGSARSSDSADTVQAERRRAAAGGHHRSV
jgi:hypothetical protein